MSIRRNRVTANQIAVITPYRRQVQRIQTLLRAKGYGSVQVRTCCLGLERSDLQYRCPATAQNVWH